ncbi:hypothetical protein LJC22_06245, partial [Desulfosarcina sp. OttesenSCG-928-G10]|nr:hypothetical protein [Desulfosarcina sp. OttesenSCG-928-G10]
GEVVTAPAKTLSRLLESPHDPALAIVFERLSMEERDRIEAYITDSRNRFSEKYGISLTNARIAIAAEAYCDKVTDIESVIKTLKSHYEETKTIELYFIKNHGINIVFEEEAIDIIIRYCFRTRQTPEAYYDELTAHFEHGLKLVREKTGCTRFFITRDALEQPDEYIAELLRQNIAVSALPPKPDTFRNADPI